MQNFISRVSRLFGVTSSALFLLTLTALTGLFLVLAHGWLVDGLAWRLPDSMIPRSAGTYFPAFDHPTGFGLQLERLGYLLIISAAIGLAAPRLNALATSLSSPGLERETAYRLGLALLGIAGFALYLYFGWWPDAYPSNARIHWVDGFFDRADRHTYALTKWVNQLFYDSPRLLVALYGMANTLLFAAVTRQLTGKRYIALLAGVSYLISSNMLLFANMAEDVNLSMLVLLACSYAYLRDKPVAFGLLGFLASAARPTHVLLFASLWGIDWLGHFFRDLPQRGVTKAFIEACRSRFLVRSAIAILAPLLLWHGWMISADQHFLFTNSNSTIDNLSAQQSIEIDGFHISQFSGAALFHFFWIFPITALGAWLLFPVVLKSLSRKQRVFAIASTLFVLTNIALVEYLKMYYFNVRYITYYFPLVLACAWMVAAQLTVSHRPLQWMAIAVLTFSTATPFNYAPSRTAKVASYPFSKLYDSRFELRELTADCRHIFTDFERRSQRNFLSYLLKRPAGEISAISKGTAGTKDCFIGSTPGEIPPADGVKKLTEEIVFVRVE